MAWCEENGCDYIFGFQGNSGLDARVPDPVETMLLRHAASCGEHDKARACVDFQHRPRSWQASRRFIARIEVSYQQTKSGHLTQATDIRYCVTSLEDDPDHLFDKVYCARGQAENLIKLHRAQLASDRTSCHSATANQVRLVLHTAAYWLMDGLRSRLPKTTGAQPVRCPGGGFRVGRALMSSGARRPFEPLHRQPQRVAPRVPDQRPERPPTAHATANPRKLRLLMHRSG
jgi:hypothetical protein